MAITERDEPYMLRALELAARGTALTSPNPMVGCVLLDNDNQFAGEGWHEYDKRDHAEIVAIRAAGQRTHGGTAYVTLEPCSHTGRTGPCADALIASGIRRAVIATEDANPVVRGNGIAKLQNAGITVDVGLCRNQAQHLNEPFARWIQSRRPFVQMKVAMTLDGRIAPSPVTHTKREPYWITSETARNVVQQMRHASDGILTGIDTVLADDPQLTDRSGQLRRRPLLRVMLDSQLRIPLDAKLILSAQNDVLIYTTSTDKTKFAALGKRNIRVKSVPATEDGHIPLDRVLDDLGREGILSLLTECGTRLNTALLTGNYVDRIDLFIAPQLLGADAIPAFGPLPAALRCDEFRIRQYGPDTGLTSLLRNPWSL